MDVSFSKEKKTREATCKSQSLSILFFKSRFYNCFELGVIKNYCSLFKTQMTELCPSLFLASSAMRNRSFETNLSTGS